MLASAVKKYIDYYGVRCGLENVIFTNNDSAYETALSLHKSGTKLNAIIDIRDNSSSEIVNKVKSLGIQIYWNHTVVNTNCLLYTSPSPRDRQKSRMPSSA